MTQPNNFIDSELINSLLNETAQPTHEEITQILQKAENNERIIPREVALLLNCEQPDLLNKLFTTANAIKKKIYGDRIVVFAPLYISNYCVNNCTYCGYKRENPLPRRRLTMSEIRREVEILERMGHKRLALEVGEDPRNCSLDYVLEALKTIYSTHSKTGAIRRVNVNIAATTVEEYTRLKDAGIGTYILFQETYHQPTYGTTHPRSLKSDYLYHLNAFDRAMEGGIDDVGGGVLFGLYDWKYEVMGLLLHNNHLEERFGVGFHTVSVPRMKRAEGVSLSDFPYLIDDDSFKRIVTILRLALPHTGIILSTRESAELRKEMIHLGVSQISAGSNTGVGGYQHDEQSRHTEQFEVEDNRPPLEVLKELLREGFLPSYCTACYRSGRTGDRFMQLARTGNIQNVCQPNALMTLMEYAVSYGDQELMEAARTLVTKELDKITNPKIKEYTRQSIEKIEQGETDFFV